MLDVAVEIVIQLQCNVKMFHLNCIRKKEKNKKTKIQTHLHWTNLLQFFTRSLIYNILNPCKLPLLLWSQSPLSIFSNLLLITEFHIAGTNFNMEAYLNRRPSIYSYWTCIIPQIRLLHLALCH